jgi:capsular polysaccharide transport system permease protein
MADSNSPSQTQRSAISTQAAVLYALLLRELHVRFGRDNIGYLWMLGEPMMLASVISTVHYFTQGHHGHGIQPFPFTVVGYCLFIIFRGVFNKAEGAIEGSLPLLQHRMISPFDIMVVKAIIEALGCIASLIILLGIGILLGLADLPARPLYLMFGAFLITWWSFGLSLLVAGITFGSHTLGRLVHPVSYFLLPISGAFFTMSLVPVNFQKFLAWNPMVTMFEIARYGQFRWADDRYMYPEFAITSCALLTYLGLIVIRMLKEKIQVG